VNEEDDNEADKSCHIDYITKAILSFKDSHINNLLSFRDAKFSVDFRIVWGFEDSNWI
jgi:hypothetical protein